MKLFLFIIISSVLLSAKIDLNTATAKDLEGLPLSKYQVESIIIHRNQINGFDTVYDLLHIENISIY